MRRDAVATSTGTVLLLHVPRALTPYYEHTSRLVIREISSALSAGGLATCVARYRPGCPRDLAETHGPAPVLNMAYGYLERKSGVSRSQAEIVREMEAVGFRAAGSSGAVQALVQDKLECGNALQRLGYEVPKLIQFGLSSSQHLLVVKPRFGACHRGVRLLNADKVRPSDFSDEILIQEYVDGLEFTVGVVEQFGEAVAFPPLFMEFQSPDPCVMNRAAQWNVIPDLRDPYKLKAIGASIFTGLGMRGYARIDLRIRHGVPVVLDVNSLPNLDNKRSYLPIAAEAAGWSYRQLISTIVASTTGRPHA
jgi:hypothetical protein